MIGRLVDRAWERKSFRALLDVLPFLIITGELAFDPDALEGLELLIQTIQSDDDILAWIDYLRLPADGWVGTELPDLDLYASNTQSAFDPLDLLIGKAYAGSGAKGVRLSEEALKKVLKSLKRLRKNGKISKEEARKIMDGVKGLTGFAKGTNLAKLRRLVHKPQTLLFAKAVGSNALRQIYRKSKQLRMSPLTMTAIIAYLETRRNCVLEVDGDKCKTLATKVRTKLDKLYLKAITDKLKAEKFGGLARESGGFFHVAMLALKHLEFEMEELMQAGTGATDFIEIMQPIDV
ncbi:MAG: hypothetical protein P8098_20945, partial [Candidatus Thiodiazotropha sp.]